MWIACTGRTGVAGADADPRRRTREAPGAVRSRRSCMREMELIPEWFLARHLRRLPTPGERAMLDRLFDFAFSQRPFAAGDFRTPRLSFAQLLVTDEANPGVLDFQDAVRGAVTYDVVSLLKDCYVAWPRERVVGWLVEYRERLLRAGFDLGADREQLIRWFDLMGLQRHIKVLGIFARLHYRDGKAGYLEDLPRVLRTRARPPRAIPRRLEFARFIAERVDPAFEPAQTRARAQAALAKSRAVSP